MVVRIFVWMSSVVMELLIIYLKNVTMGTILMRMDVQDLVYSNSVEMVYFSRI